MIAPACEIAARVRGIGIGDEKAHRPGLWTRRTDHEANRDRVHGPKHPRFGTQIWQRRCQEAGCSWRQDSPLPRIVDADHPETDG